MGIAIWAAIAVGIAYGVLPRARLNRAVWTGLGGIAALACLTLLSLSWTDSDELTYAEAARVFQYLGFVVLAVTSLNRYTWRGAAAGLAAVALLIPLFAVASRLAPDLFTDETARVLLSDRLSFPLEYWNAVGAWGAIAIALGLCWSGHAKLPAVRGLALAAVPVAALSVYLSYSRGGVIATAIALVAAVSFSRNRWTVGVNAAAAAAAAAVAILVARGQSEIANGTGDEGAGAVVFVLVVGAAACAAVAVLGHRLGVDRFRLQPGVARAATAAAAICALVGVAALNGPIGNAWDEFRNERTSVNEDDPAARLTSAGGSRYDIWTAALDAFESDSSRGIGAGTFEFYWNRHGATGEFVRDGHSLYFETLGELGFAGLLCLLAGLGGLGVAALSTRLTSARAHEAGAAGALCAGFAVFLFSAGIDWMWELGAVAFLAVGGLAVAGAGGLERARRGRIHPLATAGLVAAALACAAIQVPELTSIERMRAADSRLAAGNLSEADELANEAVEAEPWAASPYAMRALVAERSGDLPAARADLQDAIEREPTNFRHHLVLARVEVELGDSAAARRQLAEARRLAPLSLLTRATAPGVLAIEARLAAPSGTRP